MKVTEEEKYEIGRRRNESGKIKGGETVGLLRSLSGFAESPQPQVLVQSHTDTLTAW